MSERTNADIIRIVEKWQDAGFVQELTCRADRRHLALAPVEQDGKVVLLCPTCRTIEDEIPAIVLGSEAVIDFNLRLMVSAYTDQKEREARQDVWWMVVFIMTACIVLGGLFWGLPFAILGAGVGAGIAGPLAVRKFRKIGDDAESRP